MINRITARHPAAATLCRGRPLATGAFAFALVACHDSEPLGPQAPPASDTVSAAARPRVVRPEEALFADLEARVPGSAGFFADDQGRLHVVIKRTADATPARVAIREYLATDRLDLGRSRPKDPTDVEIVVKEGEYTFAELARTRDRLYDEVLGRTGGVTLLDVDEARNRVVVGVDPARLAELRTSLGAQLRATGVDPALVLIEPRSVLPATGLAAASLSMMVPSTINGHADPVVGGVGISTAGGCTLGVVADRSGVRGFVTASHCSSVMYAVDNSPMSQGFREIGYETVDSPAWSCDWFGNCRGSDAAFYTGHAGIASSVGLIAKPTFSAGPRPGGTDPATYSGSLTWDQNTPYFIIRSAATGTLTGVRINKVGATSGWTWGHVTATCVDVLREGSPWWPSQHNITCVNESNMHVYHGDSGSPVFMHDLSHTVTLGGVVFATNNAYTRSYYSTIWRLQNHNEVGALTTVRGYALATPVLNGSISQGNPVISWAAVPGAAVYHVYRAWFRYATGEGEPNPVYVGPAYSTDYLDTELPVTQYTGGTNPGPKAPGYVRYYIFAENQTEVSPTSSSVWFKLAP